MPGGAAGPLRVVDSPIRPGRLFGVRAGQVVATQLAAVTVLIGSIIGIPALVAAAVVALAMLTATWLRPRGRWLFEWLAVALRFTARRRSASSDAAPDAALRLAAPGARVEPADHGEGPAAILVDEVGLTAVLELGDPGSLLAGDGPALPAPATLLPPAGPEQPPVLIQLILTGAPAPAVRAGARLAAASYRRLTEGRVPGYRRALLTVRIVRAEGWSEDELRRSLSSLTRRLLRRLAAVPARPLGEAATVRVIAELAHDDGSGPLRETWSGLRIGGLTQATFRLERLPDARAEPARRLVERMLALPAAATTVSLRVGPGSHHGPAPVDLTVRLAAPDATALTAAAQALRTMLSAEHARARRLDGEHLLGLYATLPLGGVPAAVPGLPAEIHPADHLDALRLSVGTAGLMLGRNRHGEPLVIRLFRPEQTRLLVIGGVRCAQLLAVRAMAIGARVVIQTIRPQSWEPFVRGAGGLDESIVVAPPGRAFDPAPGTALRPLLMVVDEGPTGGDTWPAGAETWPAGAWQATLVVRDEFAEADVESAARADLLVLQPLRPAEATLLGGVLGLGEVAQWTTRIRPDMVGVVNRRAVRWAALSQTPIEDQLIGAPTR